MLQSEHRLDRFLPTKTSLSAEELKKLRLLIFVSFLTSVLGLVYLVFSLLIGFMIGAGMMVFATVLFTSLPFLVRAGSRPRLIAHIYVAGVFLNTIVLTSVTGGLSESITSTYIPLIPLVAVMLIDKRAGIVWFAVAIAEVAALGGAEIAGVSFESRYGAQFDAAFELAALVGVVVIVFVTVRYFDKTAQNALRLAEEEQEKTQQLLLNILPAEVAEELKATGRSEAQEFDSVTILFSDFANFTAISSGMTPSDLVAELNTCFQAFDALMDKYNLEKIKTIGDAYMAAAGLPHEHEATPADMVMAAIEMQGYLSAHNAENARAGKPAFFMRIGMHTGPVVAGIVGTKKFQYDVWGDTVNTASRLETAGQVGRVNVSHATFLRVNDDPRLKCTSRGRVAAKGKGDLVMYFVESAAGSLNHEIAPQSMPT